MFKTFVQNDGSIKMPEELYAYKAGFLQLVSKKDSIKRDHIGGDKIDLESQVEIFRDKVSCKLLDVNLYSYL